MGCGASRTGSGDELTSKGSRVSFLDDRLETNVESKKYLKKHKNQLKKTKHPAAALDRSGSLLVKSGKFSSRHIKQTPAPGRPRAASARGKLAVPLLADDADVLSKEPAKPSPVKPFADGVAAAESKERAETPSGAMAASSRPTSTPPAAAASTPSPSPRAAAVRVTNSKATPNLTVSSPTPPPARSAPSPPASPMKAAAAIAAVSSGSSRSNASPALVRVSTPSQPPRSSSPLLGPARSDSPLNAGRASLNVDLSEALNVAASQGKPLKATAPPPSSYKPSRPSSASLSAAITTASAATLDPYALPQLSVDVSQRRSLYGPRASSGTGLSHSRNAALLQSSSPRSAAQGNHSGQLPQSRQPVYDFSMLADSRDSYFGTAAMGATARGTADCSVDHFFTAPMSEAASVRGSRALDSLLPSPRPPHRGDGNSHNNTRNSMAESDGYFADRMANTSSPSQPRELSSMMGLDSLFFSSHELQLLNATSESADVESSLVQMPAMNKAGSRSRPAPHHGQGSGEEEEDNKGTTRSEDAMAPMARRTRLPLRGPSGATNDKRRTATAHGDVVSEDPSSDDGDDVRQPSLLRHSSDLSDVVVGSSMSLLADVKGRRRTVTIVEPKGRPPPLSRPAMEEQKRGDDGSVAMVVAQNKQSGAMQRRGYAHALTPMKYIQGPQNLPSPQKYNSNPHQYHYPHNHQRQQQQQQGLVMTNNIRFYQTPMAQQSMPAAKAMKESPTLPMTPLTSSKRGVLVRERANAVQH